MKGAYSDTIIAPGTPTTATGAIAIVRLSGENALPIVLEVFSAKNLIIDNIVPRMMYLGTITTEHFKDKAFCVYYKAPVSYTGEDVVEIQLHGGKSIVQGIVRELVNRGARPAQAGEFTKRAFLNGKMSLAEAEGVADIINAESEAGIMQAYRMMSGETSKQIYSISQILLLASASIEVALDYPEELLEDTKSPVMDYLQDAKQKLSELLLNSKSRRFYSDGVTVAFAGLTNVGKSSLMNALLKDERAIVTDLAGTTRDTLKEQFEINGIKINLIDTAGIRESSDVVEKIGVERAKKAIDSADLVLFVKDLSLPETKEEIELLKAVSHKNPLIIGNKCDNNAYNRYADIYTSATTGSGIQNLIDTMFKRLDINTANTGAILTRERHIFAVRSALESVDEALNSYNSVTPDCVIENIKTAYHHLTEITGEDASESVVDKIFSEFCVGK